MGTFRGFFRIGCFGIKYFVLTPSEMYRLLDLDSKLSHNSESGIKLRNFFRGPWEIKLAKLFLDIRCRWQNEIGMTSFCVSQSRRANSNWQQLFDQNVTRVEDLLIEVELEAVCAGSWPYLWLLRFSVFLLMVPYTKKTYFKTGCTEILYVVRTCWVLSMDLIRKNS